METLGVTFTETAGEVVAETELFGAALVEIVAVGFTVWLVASCVFCRQAVKANNNSAKPDKIFYLHYFLSFNFCLLLKKSLYLTINL